MKKNIDNLNKNNLILFIKIIQLNTKLLNNYKNILSNIETLEKKLTQKINSKISENSNQIDLLNKTLDYYTIISHNLIIK
jgi:hypothetical protein